MAQNFENNLKLINKFLLNESLINLDHCDPSTMIDEKINKIKESIPTDRLLSWKEISDLLSDDSDDIFDDSNFENIFECGINNNSSSDDEEDNYVIPEEFNDSVKLNLKKKFTIVENYFK